ncbi:hypothetical protein ACWEOZ_12455 [Actinoplanes sp. NPDC004185]
MPSRNADGESRLSLWLRVREFAVPPSMIEAATACRAEHDWAAACAAARVDVEFDLRSLARTRGSELAARIRAHLRNLAPDLLRWHLPRIAPDGLLRPGLTISLACYDGLHLVVRTPPAWANAGQRCSLALWDRAGPGGPRPDRRFRLDLHRHLWDASRAGELRDRSIVDQEARWAAEAAILLRSEGRSSGAVAVRFGGRRRLLLELAETGSLTVSAYPGWGWAAALPVLPDAATWELPDRALLRHGLIEPDRLHPLVAAALAPDQPRGTAPAPQPGAGPRLVECRGATHRIALVDGVLAPLDHSPDEIRREELLAALTGTPVACLQAIDEAHRGPAELADVRARLDHGDAAGALAVVESLLGPEAVLRGGGLRDELETAVLRRITHGLFRAGLTGRGPLSTCREERSRYRGHPRLAGAR